MAYVPHQLHKISVRKALAPRREPYWSAPIVQGQHVGFRKIDAERGTWIARLMDDAGHQKYHSLGAQTAAFGFDEAKAAAVAWFKDREAGIASGEVVTVEDACRRYVEERGKTKSAECAQDARKRFERTVDGTPFGARALAKLRSAHVRQWRDDLGLGEASSNRTLMTLKAALNLAVRERNVSAGQAQEWADVKAHKNAGKRRDLFLDLKQRRALLAASKGAIHDLLEAAILTGARPGELVKATRRQFDARTGSMTFSGKTGPRTVPLSAEAVKLFNRLAKDKLPAARLLVRDDGKPWAHSDWDELVRAAASKAKLPAGTCLYTLRHSFITAALTSGMVTLDVCRLVGTSLAMVEKHYGHLASGAARDALNLVKLV